ncbi:ABC transporter substrate-binding protein [Paenibacillus jilunlii]|uniref:Carbohydrate ABC transporter substrate-binding protein, CUT1 family n=2 Tax=Paenibacillus jilunlii TaxID=682956 RepID=A0A1G9J8D5_9BACL|nr:extracellular solute-binding protein [Paenibacillus jilunlii]SDL33404.1 carbohydrate ABC transporter substrate-binding protein, CUT1 family [Paenibacillus jilunlii]
MKKKTWLAGMTSLVLLTGLLAGCSGNGNGNSNSSAPNNESAGKNNSESSKGTVTLKMWGGVPPESGPQEVIDNWNKAHPEIQVEYVRFVNDDDGNLKLDTAMITGQDVDLFVNYTVSHAAKRVESNLALDLSKFTDYNIDEKMGSDAEGWKIDGKYYGVPTTKSAFFIALNKDALDAAGLPVPKDWTWDELREYAKKLKVGDKYGFIQNMEPFVDPIDSVLSQEGYTKADGTSNLDHPLVRKWLETLNGMMLEDKTTPPLGEQLTSKMPVEQVFLSGEVPMLNIGAWLLRSSNNFTDFPRDFKIAFAQVPRLAGSADQYVTRGGLGDYISINANSKKQEAAWEFLKWYSDGGMAPMAAGGRLPASKDANQDDALNSLLGDKRDTYDLDSLMYVMFDDKTPTYVRSLPQEVMDLRSQEYEKYFLGSQSLDQTIDAMVARHDSYLKQNK